MKIPGAIGIGFGACGIALASIHACSPYSGASTSGAAIDGSTDGGAIPTNGSDGAIAQGDGGSGLCSAPHTLCSSFDGTDVTDDHMWIVEPDNQLGFVSLDTTFAISPPASLRSTLQEGGVAVARLQAELPDVTGKRIQLDLDLNVTDPSFTTAPTGDDMHYLSLFELYCGSAGGLYVFVYPPANLEIVAGSAVTPFGALEVQRAHHFSLTVENGKATLVMDDQTSAIVAVDSPFCSGKSVTLNLGASTYQIANPVAIDYDNVVLDVTP